MSLNSARNIVSGEKWYLWIVNSYRGASAFWCMQVRIALHIWNGKDKRSALGFGRFKCQLKTSSQPQLPTNSGPNSGLASAKTTSPSMPRSGPRRTRASTGLARGPSQPRLQPVPEQWPRHGDRVLAPRRRFRGLGVRREAGAATWFARVLPRQALRAAGERAGSLASLRTPGRALLGSRPDSARPIQAPLPRALCSLAPPRHPYAGRNRRFRGPA